MPNERRLPDWFKVKKPGTTNYLKLQRLLKNGNLHTVCEEAHCPNIGDCWDRLSATFMILGDLCTRRCHYCAVTTGKPYKLDMDEPERLAGTVEKLGLRYCVITSVNRDDLPDGGAFMFAKCIQLIREKMPECRVEVLIPDFQGSEKALRTVVRAKPNVLNHNIETVQSIFHSVRPRGNYMQSLDLLETAKKMDPTLVTKSGIMVGLGEDWDEILLTMADLRDRNCDLLTIGQYLRPSEKHFPMNRFYDPKEFDKLRKEGLKLGFKYVASGPLVRSSFHADEQATIAGF
jgi:lipoic acid synthetase